MSVICPCMWSGETITLHPVQCVGRRGKAPNNIISVLLTCLPLCVSKSKRSDAISTVSIELAVPHVPARVNYNNQEQSVVSCWWLITHSSFTSVLYVNHCYCNQCVMLTWCVVCEEAFYGPRKFFTAFKSACILPISWARSVQSMPPQPTSWRISCRTYTVCVLPVVQFQGLVKCCGTS